MGGGGIGGANVGAVNVGGEAGAAAAMAGLASMDIEIPADGVEFFFTTPRGKVEITARPVSESLVARLWGTGGLFAAALLLWVVTRPRLLRVYRLVAGTLTFAIVLIVAGLMGIVLGVVPLAGLVAALIGAGLIVRRMVAGKRLAVA